MQSWERRSKVINNAGHELYAECAPSAARYNLSILHRQTGNRAKPETDQKEEKKEGA